MDVKRALIVLAVLTSMLTAQPASAASMRCDVSSPILASELNAGGTWYFEVFGATPNATYAVKIQWAQDPSNGGHPSAGIDTDATGYGRTTLLRYWAPDGFLPGYFAFWDPFDPISGFVAVPGSFSVHIYTSKSSTGKGTANCAGEVL